MISKILNLLLSISNDKLLHSYAGYVISDIVFSIIPIHNHIVLSIIAFVISLIIGILKEVYDNKIQHNPIDIKDIIATVAGSLFKIGISFI